MWAYLLVAILVAFIILKLRERERFAIKYGNPFDNEDIISFDPEAKGTRLFSTTPDTCPLNKPVLDAGLCYEECDSGYHGIGPVCWADTEFNGLGTIPGLEQYTEKVRTWGVVNCRDGASDKAAWGYHDCYEWDLWKVRQVCYDGRELHGGLCYKKCPDRLPDRIDGLWHLCAKLSRGISYGRGVGDVPPLFHFGA